MKTISVDLDGVLNVYEGQYDENTIPPIKSGAAEFLKQLAEEYKIHIFTVRNDQLVYKWLQFYNLDKYIDSISSTKNNFSSVILDDRAINFNGNFNEAYNQIKKFKPHWKK